MCFVMEYCSGGELKEYLNSVGPLNENEVYAITSQMTEAIRNCHNSKIIHRDLKLENILFADPTRLRIKIVDFGIAGVTALGGEGEKSTAGSLLYLAPEVLSGKNKESTPELDVWSMGCIIYSMLTNTLPFTGQSHKEVSAKIQACKYKRLSKFEGISAPWDKLVRGMLRRTPRKRWPILRITEHLNHYRVHPQDPCDPPSDYSEDEEFKTAPATPGAAKRKIDRSPRGTQVEVPASPQMPARRANLLEPKKESPSYMQPTGNKKPRGPSPETLAV